MKKIFLVSFLLTAIAAQSQLITDSILIENHYRSFSYNTPTKDIKKGSLMFIMHGSGGSSANMIKDAAKLETYAANDKLIIVYPNGYQHYWNECRKFSTAAANKEDINEQAFFTAMINYLKKNMALIKIKYLLQVYPVAGIWLTN